MSDKQGLPRSPDSEFDLDAIIKADEEDKRKEDALLTSEKKKEDNRKRFFIGALVALFLATVVGVGVLKPFGLGGDDDGKNTDPTKSDPSVTQTTNNPTNGQGPDSEEQPFWTQKGKQYPPASNGLPLQDWQLQNSDNYKILATEEEQNKAKAAQQQTVANYNLAVPGVNSNLQTLPSRANGFTDDPSKAVLPDGSLNPKYSYWTLEGFNENVNYQLQRFVNPVFGGWQEYQYASSESLSSKTAILTDRFTNSYEPEYLASVKDKPLNTWLPIFADWNHNDYGMGDQLLASPAPRWMGSLDSVETTFTFDEAKQAYSAHVKAKVTYVAWSQSQKTLTKTGVIEFDVTSGADEKSIRYMLSNSKLEMTA